jgi:ABC-type sugar transport system ATPase subunit
LELVGFPKANLVPGQAKEGRVVAGPFAFAMSADPSIDRVVVGVRPEAFKLWPTGKIKGRVALVEHLGSEVVVHIEAAGTALSAAFAADQPIPLFESDVSFDVEPTEIMIFDASSGCALGRGTA